MQSNAMMGSIKCTLMTQPLYDYDYIECRLMMITAKYMFQQMLGVCGTSRVSPGCSGRPEQLLICLLVHRKMFTDCAFDRTETCTADS